MIMRKIRRVAILLTAISGASVAMADGVSTGLEDPTVIPAPRSAATTATTAPMIIGSNASGRAGVTADQVYGYDVNIAYDHVVVGMAIFAGLFLMTEWMEAR